MSLSNRTPFARPLPPCLPHTTTNMNVDLAIPSSSTALTDRGDIFTVTIHSRSYRRSASARPHKSRTTTPRFPTNPPTARLNAPKKRARGGERFVQWNNFFVMNRSDVSLMMWSQANQHQNSQKTPWNSGPSVTNLADRWIDAGAFIPRRASPQLCVENNYYVSYCAALPLWETRVPLGKCGEHGLFPLSTAPTLRLK